MAEFGNGRKNRIPISRDDIKQAIKNANARLKKANDKLDEEIANKKNSLSSISRKTLSSEIELKSIVSSIENVKKDAARANIEATKEKIKVSKIKKQLAEVLSKENSAQSSLNKLTKESEILSNKIDKMNDSLSVATSIKEEIKLLKSDKGLEIKELNELNSEANGIKEELPKLRTDITKKKRIHKELLANLDSEVKDKEGLLKGIDRKYTIKMAELNAKLRGLKDHAEDKEQEANVLESLVKRREQDFIDMESKCRQAENALIYAKELTDKEVDRERKEVEKIKEGFKKWKIGALEEVARLKLKKKIENINKAGLAEILNG